MLHKYNHTKINYVTRILNEYKFILQNKLKHNFASVSFAQYKSNLIRVT